MSTVRGVMVLALLAVPGVHFGGEADDFIYRYVQEGNLAKVKELLAKNPKLSIKANHGSYPLQIAADRGFVAIADALIVAGARLDIETAAALGRTKEVRAMLKEKPGLAKHPHKPLHWAAWHRHVEIVKLLLEHGADPNLDFGFANVIGPFTPFSGAVECGSFEIAKLLCDHGAKMNVSGGRNHHSLFHYAVTHRDGRFVRLMLEHKSDPNARDSWGVTPLHITADLGSIEKAKILLDYKADINVTTSDGATPLYFAAVRRHGAYCDFLLKHGARLDIYSACALGKAAEATSLLKANPELARTRDKRLRRTPLFWAARSGDIKLVELLLALGAGVNLHAPKYAFVSNVVMGPYLFTRPSGDNVGETPLHLAATEGHLELVRVLLDKGADVNARDEDGGTPLQLACQMHHADVAKLLLQKGAAVNANDEWGDTALHAADGDTACIAPLVAAKADVNAANKEGVTPLGSAAYKDAREAAELLLAHGARLDLFSACLLGKVNEVRKLLAEDPDGLEKVQSKHLDETPLMLAARAGQTKVVRLLTERGAKYEPAKVPYPSPMHLAAMHGRIEVIQVFLDKGVSVNARSDGATALMDAASFTQLETVGFLLDKKADAKLIAAKMYPAWGSALQCIGGEHVAWGPQNRQNKADRGRRETELARLLIKAGADVNAVDQDGRTPLHAAVERGQTELAAELLAQGARVNVRDQFDLTPLGMLRHADEPNRRQMLKLLRDKGGTE